MTDETGTINALSKEVKARLIMEMLLRECIGCPPDDRYGARRFRKT